MKNFIRYILNRLVVRCCILIIVFLFGSVRASAQKKLPLYEEGVIYLRLRDECNLVLRTPESTGDATLTKVFKKYGVYELHRPFVLLKTNEFDRWYEVRFYNPTVVNDFLKALAQIKIVRMAEKKPAHYSYQYIPNDPLAQNSNPNFQYALNRIRAFDAFQIHRGGNCVIAIVDDAVQISHPDLTQNVWTNPGEIPGNNIDDDQNGYVDDIHGFDVADLDNDPSPPTTATSSTFTHGTHCAGIAAATTDNTTGMASAGFGNPFIAVKTVRSSSPNPASLNNPYEGVTYAMNAGARVISMSWGGEAPSEAEYQVMQEAFARDIVLVAAAGNDNHSQFHFPAAYGVAGAYTPINVNPLVGFPNADMVVAVASTDGGDVKSSFSNFGSWVDVAAPGTSIQSTLVPSVYGPLSGTSMACPLVAGIAGLMRSYSTSMNNAQIISCLRNGADNIYGISQNATFASGNQLGIGRVNAFASLQCMCPPASAVSNLTVTGSAGAALPAVYMVGTAYTFVASATSLTGTISYQWTINGNPAGTSSQLTHTFTQTGTQLVRVFATNSGGVNCAQRFAFTAPVECPINADITLSSAFVPPGGTVNVTPTGGGTNPAGTTYSWTLNGSPVIPGAGGSIQLNTIGQVVIALTATHPQLNCSRTSSRIISVGQCVVQQQEAAHWIFGFDAHLDFYPASGSAPAQVGPTTFNSMEGSASISDANGDLMLYSNGVELRDRNSQPLLPTAGPVPPLNAPVNQLRGHNSSTQSVVILPHPDPAQAGIYYVITSAVVSDPQGINLYVVDMRTSPGQVIFGPLELIPGQGTEGITAIRHCNGRDFWVAAYDLANRRIGIIAINANTPLNPAINQVSINWYPYDMLSLSRVYLKFSPGGNRLIVVGNARIPLFDFNSMTGILSNHREIGLTNAYGAEFSPNEQFVYITRPNATQRLMQFDLNNPANPAVVLAFGLTLPASGQLAGIQLGPDQRIYVANFNSQFLGIIANPNLAGTACGFNPQGLLCQSQTGILYGLPSIISSAINMNSASIFGQTQVCLPSGPVLFNGPRNCTTSSYQWRIVSGNAAIAGSATNPDVALQFNSPGTVVLELSFTSPCGTFTVQKTIQASTAQTPVSLIVSPNQVCTGALAAFTATPGFATYSWTMNGTPINNQFPPNQQSRFINTVPTVLNVTATDAGGCRSQASVTVNGSVQGAPVCTLPPIINACKNFQGLILDAGAGASFLWDDQSTGQTRTVFNSGNYSVLMTNACNMTATCNVQVNLLEIQISNTQVIPATCNAANGSIQFQLQGGTPPYTFAWNSASGSQSGLNDLNALASGTYNIIITDAMGCTEQVNGIVVGAAATSLAIAAVQVTPAGCTATGAPGSITVTLTGGTAPFEISLNGTSWTPGLTLSNLAAGTYNITVRDAAGCSVTASATVTTLNLTTTVTPVAPSCSGGTDGSLNITVTPATGFTFQYLPVSNGSFATSSGIFNLNGAATYTISITTAQGCTRVVTAAVPAAPNACCVAASDQNYRVLAANTLIPNTHAIGTSGSWSGKIYIPDGMTVSVASNVTLDITGADVVFGRCASIVFAAQSRIRANQSVFRVCDDNTSWSGITFRGIISGNITGCTFKNANIGLLFGSQSSVRLEGNHFINCGTAIRFNRTVNTGTITKNTFYVDSRTVNWCSNNARPFTGITFAGGSMEAPISENTFVSAAVNGNVALTGIAFSGVAKGHISSNRFTDNRRAITVGSSADVRIENNVCEITRDLFPLPVTGIPITVSMIEVISSNNIDLFGNSLSAYQQQQNNFIGIFVNNPGANPSADIQIWGNTILGFTRAIRMEEVTDSRIISNHVDNAYTRGIDIFNGDRILVSCNEVTMAVVPGGKPIALVYEDNRPGNNDAQHRILNNCLINANEAILVTDAMSSANDITALPLIRNNYLANYNGAGISINGMVGSLGQTGSGLDVGVNSFIASAPLAIDIRYNPPTGGSPAVAQIVAEGNFFSHSLPQVQNAVVSVFNMHGSNTNCGRQVITDNNSYIYNVTDCEPVR